jgi:cell division protein FtsL
MATATRTQWMTTFAEGLESSAAARRSAARSAGRSEAVRYYGKEATARLPQAELEIGQAKPRPQLKVVTRRRPRRGAIVTVVLLAALLLAVGIVSPVLIGSTATGVESTIGRLESQEKELAATASALSAQVSTLSAPERVAEQAAELGLGPAASVRYLDPAEFAVTAGGDTTVAGR